MPNLVALQVSSLVMYSDSLWEHHGVQVRVITVTCGKADFLFGFHFLVAAIL